jgi:signal transduction histidine kinase/ActR/RegA family two-component response regulator
MDEDTFKPEGRSARTAPFGLDLSVAVFDRAARLAEQMFSGAGASVILSKDGELWRSAYGDQLPDHDPVTEKVMADGIPLWVEDGRTHPSFAEHPLVTGPPFLRFTAVAPISLADGSRPGVLSVSGTEPHLYDAQKAARLADLAAFVADEWTRAQVVRDYEQSVRERDDALQRSERSEQRLNLALALSDLHVFELDYRRHELVKAGAEDTFFSRPMTYEDLYRDIYATVDPRDRELVVAAWTAHRETGVPYRPEYRVSRDDGQEVWAQGSVALFEDSEGRPQRLIGAIQNITARKKAERALLEAKADAEAASLAKSAFLASMSHEIRTPLNGVLGMAQAMAADELTPLQLERLAVVRQSGESLLAILNDVLDISKMEAGKVELEEIEFDLLDVAMKTHANFVSLAAEKALSFPLTLDAPPGLYNGDPTRLRQILSNLISNALKFTEAGEIRVELTHASDELQLAVIDSGIGIAEDALDAVFQRFTQADTSATRRFGGTGLGLAICRELAELMGGAITAASRPGEGSTFRLILPLPWVRAKSGIPAASAQSAAPAPAADPPLRILAAEDNPVNQLVLKTLLAQAGLELAVVENGQEALAAWRRETWDVILMDIQMPVMNGVCATRGIREAELLEGLGRTPIIGLTANAMSHQVAEYLAAGMDTVVTKPIQVEVLFAELRAVLDSALNAQQKVG